MNTRNIMSKAQCRVWPRIKGRYLPHTGYPKGLVAYMAYWEGKA